MVVEEEFLSTLDGASRNLSWDRLVLALGSVTRMLAVPGVAEYSHGMKTLSDATRLRDHVLGQLDLADSTHDPAERRARCTFVVAGAGYAGTETAAQMYLLCCRALRRYPRLRREDLRWVLVDRGSRILPELGPQLADTALRRLRRDIDVRLNNTIEKATADSVRLSDGSTLAAHTLVWCTRVTPNPIVDTLGLPTERGRLLVDAMLRVPDAPHVYALGDAAAVPDLTRPGAFTPPTAQHAQRQGRAVARNLAASLGHGTARPYRHRDLGLVVDFGGWRSPGRSASPCPGCPPPRSPADTTCSPCPPWPPASAWQWTGCWTSSSDPS